MFFIFKMIHLFYVYVCMFHELMYILYVAGAHGHQKRASDSLEMGLQMLVRCHMGARALKTDPLQEQQVLLSVWLFL